VKLLPDPQLEQYHARPTGLAQAITKESIPMTSTTFTNRSTEMNLMHEDMARAHMDARLRQARELRPGAQLSKARRLADRAERASQQARLLLARAL
jgi:hypothetical protein